MNTRVLVQTAQALIDNDKGLLAMDESNPTCDKRSARCSTAPPAAAPRGKANTRPRATPPLETH